MIATREQQKKKAIQLLMKLDVHELFLHCVASMESFVKDFFSIEYSNPELKELIDAFEATTGAYVYYVTHEYCAYGECYSFLCVSKYLDDIQRTDVVENKIGEKRVMAWVENISFPDRSEYGTIWVKNKPDGFLVRVY